MKKSKSKKSKSKSSDINIALISVILGAASFMNSIFTGIPAIILGSIALKRKIGNPAQAKLGILFGTLGSLLLIPITLIAIHFLRVPINQQTSVPKTDYNRIQNIAKALRDYKQNNGAYPACDSDQTESSCSDWQKFLSQNSGLVTYPVIFENGSEEIQKQPAGTLVFATRTDCFFSVPAPPGYLNSDDKYHPESFAALVYFYDKGRACYMVKPH